MISTRLPHTRRALVAGLGIAALSAVLSLAPAVADRSPSAPPIVYSGQALMGGSPIADGSHMIGLSLFSTPTGLTGGLCDIPAAPVTTTAGHFDIPLTTDCANVFETEAEVYVQLVVDGTTLSTRSRSGAVPYAVVAENGVPPGSIMAFAGDTPPGGWIVADGRALDSGDRRYAALFAAIGTTWGTGTDDADPATDFNVPDLRGRFARGLDDGTTGRDEDRDTRTASAPGGVTGANVGTVQDDAFELHDHGWPWYRAGAGRNLLLPEPSYVMGGGTFETGTARGGSETRPENVAVLYIIRL